ncbi:MAG: hypothetical protein FWD15_03165 [Alphaproteobacteria bacterium]|nr:hypothetical protein [Alphaproteobacteria bacterium]
MHTHDNFNEEPNRQTTQTQTPQGTPNRGDSYCGITDGACSDPSPIARHDLLRYDSDSHYDMRPTSASRLLAPFCKYEDTLCWRATPITQNQRED